jgi:hypothetical protein
MDVETHVKLRRLEWDGHIYQMDESRMPRNVLERKIYMVAKQQGSQKTGRWTWYPEMPEYCQGPQDGKDYYRTRKYGEENSGG